MYCHGRSRFVFVFGSLVFKIPRVRIFHYIWGILKDLYHLRKPLYFEPFWLKVMFIDGGIWENLREARCYRKTKHRLLAKLYLPLIFVNVYQKEEGVGNFSFGGDELTYKVSKTGDRKYLEIFLPCSHTFDHSDNFSYHNGQVKILDYGEAGFEELLAKYDKQVEKLLLSVANQPST